MNKINFIALFLIFVMIGDSVLAYPIDPARAGIYIYVYKNARKRLNPLSAATGARKPAQDKIADRQAAIVRFQKEYDNYLSHLDTALTYAADIFALYNEVKQCKESWKCIKEASKCSPLNVAAVALSSSKNRIYKELLNESIDLLSNVKVLFFGRKINKKIKKETLRENGISPDTEITIKDSPQGETSNNENNVAKMTVYERFEICNNVRKKLKNINRKLRFFALLIRTTSMMDTWYEITRKVYIPKGTREISEHCMKRWKNRLKLVNNRYKNQRIIDEGDWKIDHRILGD